MVRIAAGHEKETLESLEELYTEFVYRIDLELWHFATAGLLALVIALLTVASQAFRAARVNSA